MAEVINEEKLIISTPQKVYDDFNGFIFSNDTKVLAKLIWRSFLFQKTLTVPGDIVELGVFKGSGLLTFLKLKRILLPAITPKKVIGFDFFDTVGLLDSLVGDDKAKMEELFQSRDYAHQADAKQQMQTVIQNAGFDRSEFELVKGDVCKTSASFIEERPGFRISLLYIDLDVEQPTYESLVNLWDRVSLGGIVAFDEYALHQWSEAHGSDRFFNQRKIRLQAVDCSCPTAYVVKE